MSTKKITIVLVSAAGLFLATTVAIGADYHEGLAAYTRGDYETAFKEWQPLAAQGDAESQYRLARMYYHGEGKKDLAAAADWYRKAADQGHGKARNNLGLLYEEGSGVERDLAEAARWYRLSAEGGLATAQENLARLYDTGLGGERDSVEAVRWYRRAAEQGNVEAQFRLGSMYEEGIGVPRNFDRAASWYRRAAKQEHGPAERALGNLYNDGRGVARDSGKAAKWLGRASARGLAIDEIEVPSEADEPETALSPEPRREDPRGAYPALRPLSLLAEKGDVPSQYRLARMYSTGEGAPPSLKEAAKWYREAADRGHGMAAYKLAFLHLRGTGVPDKDYVEAHKWFGVSAELGVGDAAAWREKIGKKMTEEERVASESLLTEWKSKEQEP